MSERSQYNLSIVGTVGLPASYGGFETLAEQLTQRLFVKRSIQVFCAGKRYPNRVGRPQKAFGATLNYVEWDANGWQSIPYDFISLWRAAGNSETILVLGVSGCLLLPLIRLLWPKTRIVTNVDGLEWKRQKWGLIAGFVLRISEWSAVAFSHAVVADNESIRRHISKSYGRQSHLISYGGDQVFWNEQTPQPGIDITDLRDTRFGRGHYFFSVCRIEPENQISEILAAFAQTPEANLVIVGNWTVSPYAQKLRIKYREVSNIQLIDPIYDQGRLCALRKHAKAYVHGHSAGGTNPSLVEAMFAGSPVMAFDVDYNRYTTHDQAIYWKDTSQLIERICLTTNSELFEVSARMTEIAHHYYTWSIVIQQYENILFLTNTN
jgi:glycosyltransferase involved in cell wall biosynthesis